MTTAIIGGNLPPLDTSLANILHESGRNVILASSVEDDRLGTLPIIVNLEVSSFDSVERALNTLQREDMLAQISIIVVILPARLAEGKAIKLRPGSSGPTQTQYIGFLQQLGREIMRTHRHDGALQVYFVVPRFQQRGSRFVSDVGISLGSTALANEIQRYLQFLGFDASAVNCYVKMAVGTEIKDGWPVEAITQERMDKAALRISQVLGNSESG